MLDGDIGIFSNFLEFSRNSVKQRIIKNAIVATRIRLLVVEASVSLKYYTPFDWSVRK